MKLARDEVSSAAVTLAFTVIEAKPRVDTWGREGVQEKEHEE